MKQLLIIFIFLFTSFGMAQTQEQLDNFAQLERFEKLKDLDDNFDNIEGLENLERINKLNQLGAVSKGKSYQDARNYWTFRLEAKQTEDLFKKFKDQLKIFDNMGIHAALEHLGNVDGIGSIIGLAQATIPINLCNNFGIGQASKESKCVDKRNYLLSAMVTANTFALINTSKMTIGEKKQILEKHTAIMNKIDFEFQQMSKERDKRDSFVTLDFFN